MQENIKKKIKLLITIAIVIAFVWYLIISPMITFHNNEKKLEDAARRYFELNSGELPTGQRVKTVTLNTLYHKSFLKDDLFIPHTKKTCSVDNSWVKVKKGNNNDYKYYVYLECGVLSSSVDHKGPEINLNGDKELTLGVGEEYKEPGVKSVIDNNDGKLKVEDVTIKGEVDTSKIGTYELQYIAFDSLSNKSVVTREVKVVKKIYTTVKKDLGEATNYVGSPDNNYVRLSNMLFRIYGIDDDKNVLLVSDEDIANVNYSKIDSWLEYYYDHLNDTTKKMIVEKKYCNMELSETALDTVQCSSYTGKKKVYIPSVIEVNKSMSDGFTFMKPNTMSWVATTKDSKEAYLTRYIFFYEQKGKNFLSYSKNENYGVRPMFTIDGNSLITNGNGTKTNPYVFGDTKAAKGGTLVNERYTGEYVSIDGVIYRIIEVSKDGTTKIVSNSTIGGGADSVSSTASPGEDVIEYNPKKKSSVGYYINNRINEYINTNYFENHTFKVPIYKNKIIYGNEVETKEYKAVLFAPNMYEMFSAQPQNSGCRSYWMLNTSKGKRIAGVVYEIGVPVNGSIGSYFEAGIRVAGYLKADTTISSGSGTLEDPYVLK